MSSMLGRLAAAVADILTAIPFPSVPRRLLRGIAARARERHKLLPIVLALVVAYLGAEVTLWIARQPLIYGWRVFGWLAANKPSRLAYYHSLAHFAAFLVALKLAFEVRPLERKSP